MSDPPPSGSAAPRLIKRYANRKLYDTRSSRYVTLPQIAGYVRDGEDVQIIDNRTKENLTEVTLAQIVFEEQKSGRADAPGRGTLQDLIRQRSERLMSSIRETPRELLDELQRLADERVRGLLTAALGHVEQLQAEVGRLHDRIEQLEARLARRQGLPRREDDDDDPEAAMAEGPDGDRPEASGEDPAVGHGAPRPRSEGPPAP